MIENRWQITGQLKTNLWLFAYSVMHAKRFAQKLTLHTDDLGLKYYGELGYDEVKTTLNILEDEPSRFWSRGKMVAIENEPIGSIHIDGDVFIKKPEMINVLDFPNHDVIVQCEERLGIFMRHYFDTIHHYPIALTELPKGFNPKLKHALNCGVLGFNNEKVKSDYLKGYYNLVEQLKASEYFMDELKHNPKFEPNIVIEQFFLAGYCDKYKAKVKFVLPLYSDTDDELGTVKEMNDTANRIGYAHAWGSTKYKLIPAIKEKMKKYDPQYYRKVQKITNKITV
jgi:hypothetical protein